MPKCLVVYLCTAMVMAGSKAHTQTLFTARALALGAYSASVNDLRGFDINPAGLVGIRDWDFNTSTYGSISGGFNGFVFQGLSFGKRFLENDAVAIQYSPGSLLEFVFPTSVTLEGSATTSVDRRVEYSEPFSIGYGHRISDQLAAGVAARLRAEKVTETEYGLVYQDTVSYFAASEAVSEASLWSFDIAMRWQPHPHTAVSLVGRNLIRANETRLPTEFAHLKLPESASAEIGVSHRIGRDVRLALDASTRTSGSVGIEFNAGSGVSLRTGAYAGKAESPFVYAIGAGIGWTFRFLDVEAGYLAFLNKDRRGGSVSGDQFDPGSISRVDLNPYTSDRLLLSARAIFGNVRESLVRIQSVDMFGSIYPAAYEALAYRPIGKVKVRNVSGKPVQAKASFYIQNFMDAPTESKSVYILAEGEEEIPLTAILNEQVKKVSQLAIHEGEVYVHATPAEDYDDKARAPVLIHGRNDWDGNVHLLRYFVTPNDPAVLRYTREALLQARDSLAGIPTEMHGFRKARILFDSFAGKLVYVGDPKQSADYVQYPSETLSIRGGDCDDMTVCFSSLLNSIGISTAFVDVVPPGRPEDAHIYLLFDTGVSPKFGSSIAANPKRYVVRRNSLGEESIWIPIETTVITRGFEESWNAGAQAYYDDVEVGLGLVKGWVKIVDVY